ncbi:hypothetical protein [Streptomyces qinglanensis]|uniref:hypothetical protein n=1 Tax=Streptomyces qinglanensis TaxID=943816 RepID=UPI003D725101
MTAAPPYGNSTGACWSGTSPSYACCGARLPAPGAAGELGTEEVAHAFDAWSGYIETHPYAWRMLFRGTTGDAEARRPCGPAWSAPVSPGCGPER